MPAPTGSCVRPGSCGWPGTLWEPALPAMRPSASTSILRVCVVLPGLIAGNASSHRFLCQARILRLARNPVGAGLPAMRPSASTSILRVCVVLPGLIAGNASSHRFLCRARILRLARHPVGAGIAGDEAIRFNINLAGLCCSSRPHRWQCQLPQVPVSGPDSAAGPEPCGSWLAGDEAIRFNINLAGLCCSSWPHRWQCQLPQVPVSGLD